MRLVLPSQTQPAPQARLRYESLDHWRGLACLLVIVYHSTVMYLAASGHPETGATASSMLDWLLLQTHTFSAGVSLFFVISGYCIAAAADGVRQRGQGVGRYFVRRFRRIYPPLWIVTICSVAFFALDYWPLPGLLSHAPWAQLRPQWYSPSQWFGNVTLTETWRHYAFGAGRGHFPGQAWTLCYEEQFYLITGLLLVFCSSSFFTAMVAVTAGTLGMMALSHTLAFPIEGFFFDGCWLLFAAGVAVYYRLNHASGWRARAVDVALLAAIPASWFIPIPITGVTAGFCFAAVLPLLHPFDLQIATARLLTPLRIAGQMCYSLYLVHQLPVRAVTAALQYARLSSAAATFFVAIPSSIVVACAIGWIFHITVERRFLNTAHSEPARSRPASAALAAVPDLG